MDSKPPKVLTQRNRNVSLLTGLAKFHLSPPKNRLNERPPKRIESPIDLERKASFHRARQLFAEKANQELQKGEKLAKAPGTPKENAGPKKKLSSPFRPTFAVETESPLKQKSEPKMNNDESRTALLSRYAAKQTKLAELGREKLVLEFEILELEAQLQSSIGEQNFLDSMYTKANTEVNSLKKRVSTIFQLPLSPEIRKTASSIFSPSEFSTGAQNQMASFFSPKAPHSQKAGSPLKNSTSTFFSPPTVIPGQELKKKASAILNNKFVSEVREKIDQQQNEFEELTKKGTDFARGLFMSMAPKSEADKRQDRLVDSSFLMDNLADLSIIDRSVVLSEDEENDIDLLGKRGGIFHENILDRSFGNSDSSAIDIDDYESDSDQENM